jgi:hypothetical protein
MDLYRDTNAFVHRMRTRYEFFGKPAKTKSPFWKPKSSSYLPPTDHLHLENTIEQLKLNMVELQYTQSPSDNLTRSERVALSNLIERTDIVINKADPPIDILQAIKD